MKTGKSKIVFDMETSGLINKGMIMFYNPETAKDITEKGQCLICDMIKTMKDNGFDNLLKYIKENDIGISKSFTRHEKIGDTIFPVTYGPNGMVTVDYPEQSFLKTKSNDNSTGSTDK
jgi:hypothetical protein